METGHAKELHPSFLKQVLSLMEYISSIGLKQNHFKAYKSIHNAVIYFQRLLLNNENYYKQLDAQSDDKIQTKDSLLCTDTLLFGALASYHLALKINEIQVYVKKLSSIIINILKSNLANRNDYENWKKQQPKQSSISKIINNFTESILVNENCLILKNFQNNIFETIGFYKQAQILDDKDEFWDELNSYISDGIINEENDLIYLLDFNLDVKSPYDYLHPIITHIIHWHLKNDGTKKTLEMIKQVSEEIDKEARAILRFVLSPYPFFYSTPPHIVTLIAIKKHLNFLELK